MKTRNNCRKSAKWLLATILVAGAALCAVGEAGNCPVSANVRGHENIEWSISYAYGLFVQVFSSFALCHTEEWAGNGGARFLDMTKRVKHHARNFEVDGSMERE